MLSGFISFLIRTVPSFSQNTSSADNGIGELNKHPSIFAKSCPSTKVKFKGCVPSNDGSIIGNKCLSVLLQP